MECPLKFVSERGYFGHDKCSPRNTPLSQRAMTLEVCPRAKGAAKADWLGGFSLELIRARAKAWNVIRGIRRDRDLVVYSRVFQCLRDHGRWALRHLGCEGGLDVGRPHVSRGLRGAGSPDAGSPDEDGCR